MKLLLTILILFAISLSAAETATVKLPKNWWKASSYSYDKKYQDEWLYHVEAVIGYSKRNGNIDQEEEQYSLNAISRYKQFSLHADFVYQETDMTEYSAIDTPAGTIKTLTMAYDTYIHYDHTSIIYSILGYNYYQSDTTYIDNRDVYYVGLGFYLLQTKTHILNIELVYGYDHIEYLSTLENSGFSNAVAIKEKYNYIYDKRISLEQMFSYTLEEKKNRNEYHFNAKLNIVVIGPVSLVPYVSWDYYESLKLVNMYENDVQYGINLKISI